MSSAINVFEWLAVLFVIVGLFLLAIRIRDWIHQHQKQDPLVPEVHPDDLPNHVHHFSLRREK